MKKTHAIVLEALEVANLAWNRVSTVEEIIAALTPADIQELSQYSGKTLGSTISKILPLLETQGAVFVPGKIGRYRYYGSARRLDKDTAQLPTISSRRQRVLALVREMAKALGRSVLLGEVAEYAAQVGATDIGNKECQIDLGSLVHTGELQIAQRIWGDERGSNLYLPVELDPAQYQPKEPLTWLEAVAQAFMQIWGKRIEEARERNEMPRPVSTGDVRAAVTSLFPHYQQQMENPQLLVNAVRMLSTTDRRQLRKIERPGQKAVLWAPIEFTDEMLATSKAYGSDTQRICEAVRRAEGRLQRPVTVEDVREEIEEDDSLAPTGSVPVYAVLSDVTRTMIDSGKGRREHRVNQQVVHVGVACGKAYYGTRHTHTGQSHVQVKRLVEKWEQLEPEETVTTLDNCVIASAAIGRAKLLVVDLERIRAEGESILGKCHVYHEDRAQAEEIRSESDRFYLVTTKWLNEQGESAGLLPSSVDEHTPGWTSDELQAVLEPLYPKAQKETRARQLVPLLVRRIRRIPNPQFSRRFNQDASTAAEFLFDRFDTLTYAANQWGGTESRVHASIAKAELGMLRDYRFVIPALSSG